MMGPACQTLVPKRWHVVGIGSVAAGWVLHIVWSQLHLQLARPLGGPADKCSLLSGPTSAQKRVETQATFHKLGGQPFSLHSTLQQQQQHGEGGKTPPVSVGPVVGNLGALSPPGTFYSWKKDRKQTGALKQQGCVFDMIEASCQTHSQGFDL